jgi:hypothetical protein
VGPARLELDPPPAFASRRLGRHARPLQTPSGSILELHGTTSRWASAGSRAKSSALPDQAWVEIRDSNGGVTVLRCP